MELVGFPLKESVPRELAVVDDMDYCKDLRVERYVKAHGRPGYITMKKRFGMFKQHLEIIAFARIRDGYKE